MSDFLRSYLTVGIFGLVGVALYFLWQLVPLQLQAKKSEDFDTSSHGGRR